MHYLFEEQVDKQIDKLKYDKQAGDNETTPISNMLSEIV
jgi:hypothetical protein